MPAGSRVFMVRQIQDRGIVAAGITTGKVFEDIHWEDRHQKANYVKCRFETILAPDEVLPIELLLSKVDPVRWNSLRTSGIGVRDGAERLEALWEKHLAKLGVSSIAKTVTFGKTTPEEVLGKGARFPEGAVTRILVNAYERNDQARDACIAEFGTACVVCGFDFSVAFGPVGAGFIHVHHLKNLASIGKSYKVDPIRDLRPVCANCHCMLHQRNPCLSIDELRRIVLKGRRRRG